jgi:hypothetical protein
MTTPVQDAALPENTAPDVWTLLGADEEVADDLRALGVDVGAPFAGLDLDQAHRDAMASMFLRRQAEEIEAIRQLEKSRDLEIQFADQRYGPELDKRRIRARQLEGAALAIAEQTKNAGGYPGKKKSRDVGAGTYGYKTFATCVELTDETAFIPWAEQYAPETLRVKLTMPLSTAREYLTEGELASAKREVIRKAAQELADFVTHDGDTSELPPGFVQTPALDQFYSKPLPAAAIAGARV